jgi:hypothetical protein
MRPDEACAAAVAKVSPASQDGGKLVEERAREACLIVATMNGEPRLWIAPAGE